MGSFNFYKVVILIVFVFQGVAYSENNQAHGVVVNVESSSDGNIRERIRNNFQIIDEKLKALDETIKRVNRLSLQIDNIILNKDDLVYCAMIESFEKDLKDVSKEINQSINKRKEMIAQGYMHNSNEVVSLSEKIENSNKELLRYKKTYNRVKKQSGNFSCR